MLPKLAACLLLLGLVSVTSGVHYHYEPPQNRRSFDAPLRRGGDGFDPDMLNRFLEEYASKIKRKTEQPASSSSSTAYHDDDSKANHGIETLDERNATDAHSFRDEPSPINDTAKRHKFYNGNSHKEDRNNGWVTLEAIPWSKSKISKWQANPTTQHPWPSDAKPWDNKPSYDKPWDNDFPSRPASYENNKPWANKPQWNDNSPSPSSKPWYSDRPRPGYPTGTVDKYEDPNQAQKWPPERPSWDKYGDSSRPSADIITDNGPPNFPNNDYHRPPQSQRPSYSHHTESYIQEHGGWHDRNDFPNSGQNNKYNRPNDNYNDDDNYYNRPHFSHYNYATRSDHPSNYPSASEGKWVLLSTNRGYSKTRQRSIKFDAKTSTGADATNANKNKHDEDEEHVPAVTSKRQVRLTVLPSINGTNTTTSHGGLLEVEKTFKTVDQSQKEYEAEKTNTKSPAPNRASFLLNNRRPIRAPIITNGAPSSSAVLAAVGAGMLPATMAMMLPMMLGKRKKREIEFDDEPMSIVRLPRHVFLTNVRRAE